MEKELEPKILPAKKMLTIEEHKRFLKIAGKLSGIYSVISTNPLIFHVARSRNPVSDLKTLTNFFLTISKKKRLIFCAIGVII